MPKCNFRQNSLRRIFCRSSPTIMEWMTKLQCIKDVSQKLSKIWSIQMELKADHEKVRQSRFIPLRREREMRILKARGIFRSEAYKLRDTHVKVSKELLDRNADNIEHKVVPFIYTRRNEHCKHWFDNIQKLVRNRRNEKKTAKLLNLFKNKSIF